MKNNNLSIYKQLLNLNDAQFKLIEHEDAIVATVYKVTLPNGTHYILKICLLPRHYERELYFLNFLAGKIPVPRIIGRVPPNQKISGAILMECITGDILKKSELTESLARNMGTLLARIHNQRTVGYGDLTQPEELTNNPRLAFLEKFEKHLAECSTVFPAGLVKQCFQYVQEHVALLDSVDGPCMVHWDFRPGNVMALDGSIQGIIDWSSSRSDFAEIDFCLLEHDGWANGPGIKESFLAGYDSIRPVPSYQKVMPLLRLNKAIASIGFTIRTDTWRGRNAAFYERNRSFIETMFKL